jgi:CubicO group peptidase (beta-lactamase class C family)
LVIDPARGLVIALLTNRVHPRVADDKIAQFRPAFHDPVIEAYDG